MIISPLVSIIIPAHNEERFLSKSIDSILNQTYKNIEIILINDSSIDNTKAISMYYQKYKNINYFEVKCGSAACTRNCGAKVAKGEILIFHDADCEANPDMIENIVYEIRVFNYDGVASRTLAAKPKTLIGRAIAAQRCNNWETKKNTSFEINGNSGILVANMKKDVFEKLGGYNRKIYYFEDADLTERFFNNNYRAIYNSKTIEFHHDPDTWNESLNQAKSIGKAINNELKGKKGYRAYKKMIFPFYCLFFILAIIIYPLTLLTLIISLPFIYIFLKTLNNSRDFIGSLVLIPLIIFRNLIKLYYIFHT